MAIAVGELWGTAKHAITAYTGLSPAAFFTVVAVAAAFYYAVSGLFAPPPAPRKREMESDEAPPPPPVQLGEVTEEELLAYDGSDSTKPLLMAIKGQIYDVTQSRMFYGPGGPYALFAGKDASRALAKMSFEEKDLTGDISGLGPFELEALQDWEYKFMSKYVKVGTVKKSVPVTNETSENAAGTADTTAETVESTSRDIQAAHVAEAEKTAEGAEVPAEVVVKTEVSPSEIPAEHAVDTKEVGHIEVPLEHAVKAEEFAVDTKEVGHFEVPVEHAVETEEFAVDTKEVGHFEEAPVEHAVKTQEVAPVELVAEKVTDEPEVKEVKIKEVHASEIDDAAAAAENIKA